MELMNRVEAARYSKYYLTFIQIKVYKILKYSNCKQCGPLNSLFQADKKNVVSIR